MPLRDIQQQARTTDELNSVTSDCFDKRLVGFHHQSPRPLVVLDELYGVAGA
jgi:hypothetical protein